MINSRISGPPFASGTFVSNWLGFTTSPQTTWSWNRVGDTVTMRSNATVSAVSNANGFLGATGEVPIQIRPATTLARHLYAVTDNGVAKVGFIIVSSAGTISFLADVGSNSFAIVGVKGFVGGQQHCYTLK